MFQTQRLGPKLIQYISIGDYFGESSSAVGNRNCKHTSTMKSIGVSLLVLLAEVRFSSDTVKIGCEPGDEREGEHYL
jgi:hypothetical protein